MCLKSQILISDIKSSNCLSSYLSNYLSNNLRYICDANIHIKKCESVNFYNIKWINALNFFMNLHIRDFKKLLKISNYF